MSDIYLTPPARPGWSSGDFGEWIAAEPPKGSGRVYRWWPGAMLGVDPRDVPDFIRCGFVPEIVE